MKLFEKTIGTTEIFNGHILNLRVDDVELPDGSFSKREIVSHKGAVAVLAIKDQQVLFVNQYRIAIQKVLTEIPAGLIDPGENPEETAIRECREEIGFRPLNMFKLGVFLPTPGYCSEIITLFCATEFANDPKKNPDEFLRTMKIPLRTVKALYLNGLFTDGKTAAALGYYFSLTSMGLL